MSHGRVCKVISLAVGLALLAGCRGSEAEYTAIYQVVPDARVLYLGGRLYLVRDTAGTMFLVKVDNDGEVASVDRLF